MPPSFEQNSLHHLHDCTQIARRLIVAVKPLQMEGLPPPLLFKWCNKPKIREKSGKSPGNLLIGVISPALSSLMFVAFIKSRRSRIRQLTNFSFRFCNVYLQSLKFTPESILSFYFVSQYLPEVLGGTLMCHHKSRTHVFDLDDLCILPCENINDHALLLGLYTLDTFLHLSISSSF